MSDLELLLSPASADGAEAGGGSGAPSAGGHPTAPGKPVSGRDRHIPFVEHLGFQREFAEAGKAIVSVELRPELTNNHGGGHGGLVMTLLDSAMAHAALSKIDYTREVVSIDVHVSFLRPSTGKLTATGQAVGGGKSVCFCEAQIVDGEGQVAARAMGTFRYRQPGGTHAPAWKAGE